MKKIQVWNNSRREHLLIGVPAGVLLAVAAYFLAIALA
jgi:hypothetical protein